MRVAVDPGTRKCGWALGLPGGESFLKGTVNLEMLEEHLIWIARQFKVELVLVGSGTNSGKVALVCRKAFGTGNVHIVDERGSTEEAKRLFLRERGKSIVVFALRLLVLLFFNPPLDGYAALGLLRRYGNS